MYKKNVINILKTLKIMSCRDKTNTEITRDFVFEVNILSKLAKCTALLLRRQIN